MGINKEGMPSGLTLMSGLGRDPDVLTAGRSNGITPFRLRKF